MRMREGGSRQRGRWRLGGEMRGGTTGEGGEIEVEMLGKEMVGDDSQ